MPKTSSRSTRRCPAPGCGLPIPAYLFACRDHWRQLPAEHKDAVGAAYRHWSQGVGQLELEDLIKAGRDLRAAQAAAIAWLEESAA